LESLRAKVVEMEMRHVRREQQLQQLLIQQQSTSSPSRDDMTSRWRALIDEKNREIDRFRAELDSILHVLRRLQSEGVVVAYTSCDHAVINNNGLTEPVNYLLNDYQLVSRT